MLKADDARTEYLRDTLAKLEDKLLLQTQRCEETRIHIEVIRQEIGRNSAK